MIDSFHRLENSRLARMVGVKPSANNDQYITFFKDKAVDGVTYVLSSVATVVKSGASVLLLMAFMLFGRRPGRRLPGGIISEIESRVQQYISLTVLISAVTGLLVGLPLAILDIKFAAGFGFLAFLLNFIPNIGAVIATLLPLPVIFLDPQLHGHFVTQLLAIAIPAGIQVGLGSLQPRLLGNSLDLHPVVVLLSLLFFTLIWGVAGAFLATPLTAVIRIVFEKIPATRALAAALAGNLQPLTETIDPPVEDVLVMQERKVSSRQLEAGL
jgi:AI-2 transport protein TqsA